MKFIVFLFIFYFQFFSDDVYIVYSDIQSPLDNLVVTARHQHLVFSLDACKEAYIFLTSHPEDLLQNSYQILIGTSENKQSSIRKMAPFEDIRNFDTYNILSCGNTQTMWISWSAGNISVGIGVDVGENVKFTWIDNQPYSINGFALASADDNPVKWMFPRGYGIAFFSALVFYFFKWPAAIHNKFHQRIKILVFYFSKWPAAIHNKFHQRIKILVFYFSKRPAAIHNKFHQRIKIASQFHIMSEFCYFS